MILIATASFARALVADGPTPDRADGMRLYGFLVGRWIMDGITYHDDGSFSRDRGSIHAGWVLGGCAIQDIWNFPGAFYGTTLRVYDPALDAWHILWSDPMRQLFLRQLGRAQGDDIVQEGKAGNGLFTRWRFTEITAQSFHWLGERSTDGATWQLRAEFFARRTDD